MIATSSKGFRASGNSNLKITKPYFHHKYKHKLNNPNFNAETGGIHANTVMIDSVLEKQTLNKKQFPCSSHVCVSTYA